MSEERLTIAPTREDFSQALAAMLVTAQQIGACFVGIRAKDVHLKVGGYPIPFNRMPMCCAVMRQAMQEGDHIVKAPPQGDGASLVIQYQLPRE